MHDHPSQPPPRRGQGRLFIQHNGVVSVEAENFTNAQCFTSLDGASFMP